MTGFFITIANGLLKDGHRKRMGSSVWEFMWCIDKVTRIDEDGTGWVLGGKPIQLADIAKEMGVSRDSVSENLIKLQKFGYILKINTPYGIVIKVKKTKKRFGKYPEPRRENAEPRRENAEPNKTIQRQGSRQDRFLKKNRRDKKMKNHNEDEEKVIDLDTGEYTGTPTAKPKKSKEAIRLAQLFDALASKYSKRDIVTPKSYFIVMNAMNRHTLEPVQVESIFRDWFDQEKVKHEDKVKLNFALTSNNINQWKVKNSGTKKSRKPIIEMHGNVARIVGYEKEEA